MALNILTRRCRGHALITETRLPSVSTDSTATADRQSAGYVRDNCLE